MDLATSKVKPALQGRKDSIRSKKLKQAMGVL
jgi:hypothetical protein